MLHAIRGKVIECTPGEVVLEAGGLEYEVLVSLLAYEQLAGKKEVRLLVREIITETSHTLYGFSSREERSLFEHLLEVSGIGAKLALKILSSHPPERVAATIADGDVAALKLIKGLGTKKAELIVATLRNSVGKLAAGSSSRGGVAPPPGSLRSDAILALLRLGYRRPEAEKAVSTAAQKQGEGAALESIILEALKEL